MYNGVRVRPALVNQQVHGDLGRHVSPARNFIRIVIADHQVVRLHHAFADGRRCGENAMVIQPEGNIAVVRGDETLPVDPSPDLHNFAAQLIFGSGEAHEKSRFAGGAGGCVSVRPALQAREANSQLNLVEGHEFVK